MGSHYKFTITHKFPSLNEVISAAKKHWAVYAKMKRDLTQLVADYAKYQGGFETQLERAHIKLTFYEHANKRKRDWDNITSGAKKFILDGLVQAGVSRTIHPTRSRRSVSV